MARENPQVQWRLWTPLPVFTTPFHPLNVADLGNDWEDNLLQGQHPATACSNNHVRRRTQFSVTAKS